MAEMAQENNGNAAEGNLETGSFRIRSFIDLRRLRSCYLRTTEGFIEIDSNDNPCPGAIEKDFGLKRSTLEEAMEFLRQSLHSSEPDDDLLLEFLDDN